MAVNNADAPIALRITGHELFPLSNPLTASTCHASGFHEINDCSQPGMVAGSAKIFDMKTRGISMIHPNDMTAETLLMVSPIIKKNQERLSAKKTIMAKDAAIDPTPASGLKPKIIPNTKTSVPETRCLMKSPMNIPESGAGNQMGIERNRSNMPFEISLLIFIPAYILLKVNV